MIDPPSSFNHISVPKKGMITLIMGMTLLPIINRLANTRMRKAPTRWKVPQSGTIIPIMGPKNANSSTANTGLASALFSGVQQRVLGALFGNPDRAFYGNELARLTKSGKGALQRELARLQGAGLVTMEAIGKQKHYRANRAAPIFAELHGIVVKTVGLADVIRAALDPLADHIEFAFVYGSVAKRSDSARSDIDLFLVSDTLSYADLIGALETAESRLARKISPLLQTRAEFDKRRTDHSSFLSRILEQPKIFVVGSESDLAQP